MPPLYPEKLAEHNCPVFLVFFLSAFQIRYASGMWQMHRGAAKYNVSIASDSCIDKSRSHRFRSAVFLSTLEFIPSRTFYAPEKKGLWAVGCVT
jgi:hypothetical protein